MKTLGWTVLVVAAAGVGLLAGKAFLRGGGSGPGIVPIIGDPPIIVHGGSFRLGFNTGAGNPGSPDQAITVKLGSSAKVDFIDLERYLPLGTPFDVSSLPGKQWEVDVCDAGGLTQPSGSSSPAVCTNEGLKICPSDATGNCGANQAYITVDRLNSSDELSALQGKPAPPFSHGYKLKPSSKKDIYHPGFLVVKITDSSNVTTTYPYTCAPASDGDNDWTTCWATFGTFK